jgi:hypothetical protein
VESCSVLQQLPTLNSAKKESKDMKIMKPHRMMLWLLALMPVIVFGAETIELEKKDYIALIVSSYVNGFNEFETSVTAFEDSVSVGIYYDQTTQDESRAEGLANRFRLQVPLRLSRYEWSEDVDVIVNVYSQDLTGRGYED